MDLWFRNYNNVARKAAEIGILGQSNSITLPRTPLQALVTGIGFYAWAHDVAVASKGIDPTRLQWDQQEAHSPSQKGDPRGVSNLA